MTRTPQGTSRASVAFLTLNDVYQLLPDDDGRGGIAEFATLLTFVRSRIPAETRVIVSLNGDFLWRSELDRKDKGALMVDLLNHLGVDLVVLGNHEFDFGEDTLQELLLGANFTTLAANIVLRDSGKPLDNTTSTRIVDLANGVRLGIFGVCTVRTAEYSFASTNVVFESEVEHADRCVRELRSQGADVVVALTHVSLSDDKLIAKRVRGIDLILGGHDHEPMSLFQGATLIHKSGQDALWLGHVHADIERNDAAGCSTVALRWGMLANRGYAPDPACVQILQAYADRVKQEKEVSGLLETLAVSRTVLDATRITCRSRESNIGSMIADAIRDEFASDVAIVNGGYIRGERLFNPGLEITRSFLLETVSYPNPGCVVEMQAADLHKIFFKLLSRYPDLNASFPQISGVYITYDICDHPNRSLRIYHDKQRTQELSPDAKVTLATSSFMLDEIDARQHGTVLTEHGRVIPDIVASFLQKRREIAYPLQEGRIVVLE